MMRVLARIAIALTAPVLLCAERTAVNAGPMQDLGPYIDQVRHEFNVPGIAVGREAGV
jgi:hypothetical protein